MQEELNILFEDNDCIIINKPPTLPTQSDKTEDKSAVDFVSEYLKKEVFVIHRLDRPASGILIFAKNKNAAAAFSALFQNQEIDKTYWAIVPKKKDMEKKGKLIHFHLKNSSAKKAIIFKKEAKGSKVAVLRYKLVEELDNYSLLEIQLETGRFHQIRAQLAAIDLPIKGDVKYGARRSNKNRAIHLHARNVEFEHPMTYEKIKLEAATPDDSIWNAIF
jgi:23S rRNA pseudouridine1911/1915/1917 synthase